MFKWLQQIATKTDFFKFFYWSNLYAIAASPVISIAVYGTILVPFLSAEIEILKAVKVLKFDPFDGIALPLSMLFSYSFSLLFAFAAVLAMLFCAPTIKMHKNIVSYLSEISSVSKRISGDDSLSDPTDNLLEKIEVGGPLTDHEIEAVIKKIVGRKGRDDFSTTVSTFTDHAVQEWTQLEESQKRLRFTIGTIFIVSFVIGFFTFFILMPISIVLA